MGMAPRFFQRLISERDAPMECASSEIPPALLINLSKAAAGLRASQSTASFSKAGSSSILMVEFPAGGSHLNAPPFLCV
jgi:hypothetical protein